MDDERLKMNNVLVLYIEVYVRKSRFEMRRWRCQLMIISPIVMTKEEPRDGSYKEGKTNHWLLVEGYLVNWYYPDIRIWSLKEIGKESIQDLVEMWGWSSTL